MAKKTRRKINVKKAPAAVARKRERNEYRQFAGGQPAVIGYTADVAGLTDLQQMRKGIYGLFEQSAPHYEVQYGDVLEMQGGLRVVNPLYPYQDLLRVYQSSTILRQCVDSYVTNIESYGTDLEYVGPEGHEDSRASQNEKARLERLLSTLTTDGRTIQKHREDSRVDKEVLGARCFEIIRDAAGRVVGFDHVATSTVRMTTKEKEYTTVEMTDPITGTGKTIKRRFRRFLQVDEQGNKTWFKELYDPRKINPKTGRVDNTLDIEDEATELFYEGLYCPGTPTGVPRWAGAIPSLLGGREAEMVNLNFFRDNAIPAMAVMVSGGALTEESFNKIDQYIQGVRGAASMNRIVVMEAVADGAEAASVDGSLPAPRVDLKPMLSERQHEGLFKDYIEDTERKARSSFRLPPIYIGSAEEYNRASAFASVLTADQQIFIPERMAWDDMFERVVLQSHNFKYWRVRSSGPGIQDPAEIARVVNSLGREGALTPNVSVKIANRYLDADIKPIMEEWGDLPFAVIMQYLKNDKTIPGLDIFEEEMNDAIDQQGDGEEGENDDLNSSEAMTPLGTSKRLLNKVADIMDERLDAALKTSEDRLQSIAEDMQQ